MRPKENGPLVAVADKHRTADQEERMRFSRTIVEEAMTTRKAILSADAATDQRFGMAQSIADFQIRSMICAPMIDSRGEPLGVLQIDTLNQRSRFTNDDLEVLAAVAGQAAVAIENARMHQEAIAQQALARDLDLASRMQRGLLPANAPALPGYVFFDYYQSARQVGGDYYGLCGTARRQNGRSCWATWLARESRRHCSWRDCRAMCASRSPVTPIPPRP